MLNSQMQRPCLGFPLVDTPGGEGWKALWSDLPPQGESYLSIHSMAFWSNNSLAVIAKGKDGKYAWIFCNVCAGFWVPPSTFWGGQVFRNEMSFCGPAHHARTVRRLRHREPIGARRGRAPLGVYISSDIAIIAPRTLRACTNHHVLVCGAAFC